jgi:hypothetical protein
MRLGGILLFLGLAPAAHGQALQGAPLSADPDTPLLSLPYSLRLELGSYTIASSPAGARSPVLTQDYWSRTYDERAQLETRFGIHLIDGWRPTLVQQSPVPGHPQFNFVQELRWPGAAATGLQFERRNLLLEGDRLTLRATSDLQTLFRGAGFSGSDTELELLSLLGWRSHSRLVWQLGEPVREWQWQLSAGMDRHAGAESSRLDFRVLRRFW